MTQEQKQAIRALNKAQYVLDEDEYFLLMGYIVKNEVVEKPSYVPQPFIWNGGITTATTDNPEICNYLNGK